MSFGCGLPLLIQTHDWSLAAEPTLNKGQLLNSAFSYESRLRIEHFRHRVSSYLASPMLDINQAAALQERGAIYRLLNAEFIELERKEKDASGKSLNLT